MQRTLMKSKVQPAVVSSSSPEGEEMLLVDREVLKRADLWPFERVEVYNLDNGARFSTALGASDPGPGVVRVQGAASLLAKTGHRLVITAFVLLNESDLPRYQPRVVTLDAKNRVVL